MNYPINLPVLWFLIVGVLLSGYAILDGFDLGVGMLLNFANSDTDRRIILNSIGPVWDGNEVWLVVGGGAMFAAFPDVYATVFSGFYMPFMILLFALIFRAVAIEFRSKEPWLWWRKTWDISFGVASVIIALLMGVALGNIVLGIPLDRHFEYTGGFFNLLNPYGLIVGVTTVAMFSMHGGIFLTLKTEGELREKAFGWVKQSMIFFGVMYALVTIATFIFAPQMADKIRSEPWLFIAPLITLLAIANVPREITRGKELNAFASSATAIASLLGLFGLGIYPRIVPCSTAISNSLTVNNAHASIPTLTVMTSIALIGMPFVIAYTVIIYRVFRGKVDPSKLLY